ncbi:phenylalanine--tRNA ligase subunit beta [Heliophilum fasciatum]|uniref:Phenylalanine--tRNA ligase beta subunit n=1 Tax=Heliophilum fasciatum TaxID=35700 RepID=A0A4R2SCG8_9FIRM|nr:phenylalanine--tRNA ligase subunit beta [Heliophilum fasciatum]MCW2276764.1 phenylalanyl-tRNA synthetase beta chain [Heliophilum fasciatum]TCP68855.1 phenylalanyl-tRNA synthetase beta subunit [Heliophilum fasciatum]
MRISMDWLGEYVAHEMTATDLAEKLTRSGIAVENVICRDRGLDHVVVGLVQRIEKHPAADKLWVCQIETGNGETTIVTGAQNVRQGHKVPVALPGACLPNGLTITPVDFRGIPSAGMLCSAQELGLDEKTIAPADRDGILILSDAAVIGKPVAAALGLDVPVLELELTPNRSDCLAVLNVAREVAAITEAPLQLPKQYAGADDQCCNGGDGCTGNKDDLCCTQDRVRITINDGDLCGRYAARLFTNLRLGPSPVWMQQRLQSAGMRPINNMVDITNYVMLELGHPLHAFDYHTIAQGEIIVRRAQDGEVLTTLDGQERTLNAGNLVIADPEKAIALAGVMGGLATEVTDNTKVVLLEAAHFNPASIRRTARQVGLRSEASQRFEKGVNVDTILFALDRTAQLVEELGVADVVPGYVDVYERPSKAASVAFSVERINGLLGTNVDGATMAHYWQRLGMTVTWSDPEGNAQGVVEVPTYRPDITGEHDLAEEVARLYGYDNIPTTLPQGATTVGQRTWPQLVQERLGEVMVASGLREVITFSFINPRHLDRLGLPENHRLRQVVAVTNPLSEEQGIMRSIILPNLLEVAARNSSRRTTDIGIFELGSVFAHPASPEPLKELPEERKKLAALLMGQPAAGWRQKPGPYDFYDLKAVIEKLLACLKINGVTWQATGALPYLHPGRAALLTVEQDGATMELGWIGEVHPDVTEAYDLPGRPVAMELDVQLLTMLARAFGEYKALPRFPSTDRDMAMLLPETVPASQVEAVIAATGGTLVDRWRLFDLYQGAQIPAGYRSLAYTLRYQASDRTLTDDEVNQAHEAIKAALTAQVGARFR